jgi:hypothetical protein
MAETRCFSVGEKRQWCPVLLVPVSLASSRSIDSAKFLEVKTINLRPPPLYSLGTTLLTSGVGGSQSEVTIGGLFWSPNSYGGPSWKYQFLGRGDDVMPEHLLVNKVIKVLSWGCVVTPEPAQQTGYAGQNEATPPVTKSSVETQRPGGVSDSNVLLREASQYTNEALDLIKRAAARKRGAAQLERDEADKLGRQMQDLDTERDRLWGRIADIKAQKDGLTSKRSDLNDRAAELTKEAEDMESLLALGALRSVAAESSTVHSHAAKRQRYE